MVPALLYFSAFSQRPLLQCGQLGVPVICISIGSLLTVSPALIASLQTIEKSVGADAPKKWNMIGSLCAPVKAPSLGQGASTNPSGLIFCVVAETEPLELTWTVAVSGP